MSAEKNAKAGDVSSGSGGSELGNPSASSGCTCSVSAADVQKLRALGAYALHMGLIRGERSTSDDPAAAAGVETLHGKRRAIRDDQFDVALGQMVPSAAVTGQRHPNHPAVPEAPVEASGSTPAWPEEPELFQLSLEMLTGGTGEAVAPMKQYPRAKATYELLVRVESAIAMWAARRPHCKHVLPACSAVVFAFPALRGSA